MAAMREIHELVGQIAREFRPERIILFGSHAYGTPGADSDVDLLVVVTDDGNPLRKAMEIRRRIPATFPLDVVVRDPQDLRWRIEQHDWFLKEIVEKGKVLHAAADG